MSTNAQLTHKWVAWTDWSQIKQVLLCLALVPKWAGGNFDAISDAWRSWTTRQRKIMTWHPLCNLPRHWRFWPTKCVWIQSFPWWIFFLIKAIWHKFVFNQCLAPVQCIGYLQASTHTTIKKPDRGYQIGLDQKHGRLLIGCLTGMENYHRLKRAAQMPLSWKMRSRIVLWTHSNTMPDELCCQAHHWALRLGQM